MIDRGRFAPTEEGTPQGGVISPLLMNVALHGLEQAAGCRYTVRAGREPGAAPGTPVLVRYTDDFIVLCHDENEVHQVRARLEEWLEPRGLRWERNWSGMAGAPAWRSVRHRTGSGGWVGATGACAASRRGVGGSERNMLIVLGDRRSRFGASPTRVGQ
ncbi:reverse transcriptase domain-containing protein [Kitasatospora sp. NPDC058190]|uniref:reverse transcriptase domain-containing protein n=1 Tax=Kitasatospora sp. NPDC058190 TaxID=3346371 RepID=UPI0036D90444